MIWFVYALVIILYFILKNINNNKAKNYYLITITFTLCVLTAMRHLAMGNDTYAYYLHFENVDDSSFAEYYKILGDNILGQTNDQMKDPGYNIFAKICYKLCYGSYELYQFLVGVLVLTPIALFMKKYVHNFSGYILSYSFFISIFYSWMPNSATRQSIAIGLYLWALWIFIKKGRWFAPVLLFVIASTIHKSVLINIVPIIIFLKKYRNNYPNYAIIGFVVMLLMGSSVAIWLGQLSNSENYMNYGLSSYYTRAAKPYGFIFQILAIYLIARWGGIRFDNSYTTSDFIKTNFMLGVILTPIILVDPSLQRLTLYFALWGVIFIPNIISEFPIRKRYLVFIVLLILTLGRPLIMGDQDYKFNWEHKEFHERYGL